MRMQRLIEGLLRYSRITVPQFVPVETGTVVSDAIANLAEAIHRSDAVITVNGTLPAVVGDETQLLQLFQNLLANALKYKKPKVPPRITVSAQWDNGEWLFSVKDNGIGIPAEDSEKVFEIFKRLHTVEEYPGTGIGLASCKKIVEQHHGRIWLESVPGEGTTFFFSLPERRHQQ
jgi:light-regulated signal transduction histidine kinase (bacteriophytochrome)